MLFLSSHLLTQYFLHRAQADTGMDGISIYHQNHTVRKVRVRDNCAQSHPVRVMSKQEFEPGPSPALLSIMPPWIFFSFLFWETFLHNPAKRLVVKSGIYWDQAARAELQQLFPKRRPRHSACLQKTRMSPVLGISVCSCNCIKA